MSAARTDSRVEDLIEQGLFPAEARAQAARERGETPAAADAEGEAACAALREAEGMLFACGDNEELAVRDGMALLTPRARLELAAELLRGLGSEPSISGDVHLKSRADFDALVQAFGAKPRWSPLSNNGLHISHTARIGDWLTIYYMETATAETLAALVSAEAA